MSLVAIVPVAQMLAANASLETDGFGPRNFSVAAFGATGPTHAALHAWNDPAFATAVKALPGVVWEESAGDPITRTQALIEAQGAQWGAQAPQLPSEGPVVTGDLYQLDGLLWWVIQSFDRTTFPLPPATYPALIRNLRKPGEVLPFVQPIDQFDAYRLPNPFTGLPDKCAHVGKTWVTLVNNNVWVPGAQGSELLWQEVI